MLLPRLNGESNWYDDLPSLLSVFFSTQSDLNLNPLLAQFHIHHFPTIRNSLILIPLPIPPHHYLLYASLPSLEIDNIALHM